MHENKDARAKGAKDAKKEVGCAFTIRVNPTESGWWFAAAVGLRGGAKFL